MAVSSLEARLIPQLEQIRVVDAHEHLVPEGMRVRGQVDVLTLFCEYISGDLRVAGMRAEDFRATQDPDLPLARRWELVRPYWEHVRGGSFARAALLAVRRFYGADDINDNTYAAISERMAAANTPGLYTRVLREACNIQVALAQCEMVDLDSPLLVPVMPIGDCAYGGQTWEKVSRPSIGGFPPPVLKEQIPRREMDPSITVTSLDDLLAVGQSYLRQMKAEGAVGIKIHARPNQPPDAAAARECFESLRQGRVKALPAENALRDYYADEMIRAAGEQGLVVCVHTGYWGDFREYDPLHMIPIISRHPEVRFDVYHLGYPWVRESIMLGKGFPNVWLNLCWLPTISEQCALQAMSELIDAVPANKVLGFGGDYWIPVENVYGHLVIARTCLARVLARRIEEGRMDETAALTLATKWLRENALRLYGLPEEWNVGTGMGG